MVNTPAPPTQVKVRLDTGLKRDVGKRSLLFTGIGSIIGSGWLFGAFTASQMVGPGAVFTWVVGGIMIMLIGLAFAELGVMFPIAGGVARFPQYAFGSFAGFTGGWTTWLAASSTTAIEVLAVTEYAEGYLPWLMNQENGVLVLSNYGLLVAIGLMLVFTAINIVGVKAFARFNDALVWWKLAIIVLVIVVFFAISFNPGNFTEFGGFLPQGTGAIFTAIPAAGIAFSYLGFRQGVEFAGETTNPQKNVPFAIIGSIAITGVIYIFLQIAFITGLPGTELVNGWAGLGQFEELAGPLAGLAILLGAGWLGVILYADAIVSPGDTGLIYAAVTTRLSYSTARSGNAPQALTRLNRFGIPWVSVIVMFVVGCLFFLPFPGWQVLVGFTTSATVLSFATGPVAVGALRRTLPDQPRPFKLPGGDAIPYLAFLSSNLIVFWTGWIKNEVLFISVIVGYIMLTIYRAVAKIRLPALDLLSGSWIIIWLVGLALISYLGSLRGSESDAIFFNGGGNGPITLAWGVLVLAVFSAVIYAYAVRTRLPAERAAVNIRSVPTDEPEEAAPVDTA